MQENDTRAPTETIDTPEGLIPGVIDGFVLIGAVRVALRDAGNPPTVLAAFSGEAMSGDYDHLLRACIAYTVPS